MGALSPTGSKGTMVSTTTVALGSRASVGKSVGVTVAVIVAVTIGVLVGTAGRCWQPESSKIYKKINIQRARRVSGSDNSILIVRNHSLQLV